MMDLADIRWQLEQRKRLTTFRTFRVVQEQDRIIGVRKSQENPLGEERQQSRFAETLLMIALKKAGVGSDGHKNVRIPAEA